MAAYPNLTAEDLASFSGRGVSEYSDYAATAIAQATLLFKIATCRSEFPNDAISAELAKMAILAMADAIFLVQPFQEVKANPFSSESIGSYSYSKVAGAVSGGLPSGITWFDLAVSQLGVCDLGIPTGGGIEVFENDVQYAPGLRAGNLRMLSPIDLDAYRSYTFDPSEGYSNGPIPDGGGFSGDSGSLDGGSF